MFVHILRLENMDTPNVNSVKYLCNVLECPNINYTFVTNLEIIICMNKQKIDKILIGCTFNAYDLSSDDKKRLNTIMYNYSMSKSTVYMRFFVWGFYLWEIYGVSQIISDFVVSVIKDIDDKDAVDQLLKVSKNPDSTFFKILTDLGMGVRLCDFMSERGMKSQTTVRKRFRTWNWKPWEMKGIKVILEEGFLKDTSDK